jgi:hypothetical protein
MFNRYANLQTILNDREIYSDILRRKRQTYINHHVVFDFSKLKNINLNNFDSVIHTFTRGEKLYTISQKYYNAPEYGWLILYLNKIPSELDIKEGDPLMIYFPLDYFLGQLG